MGEVTLRNGNSRLLNVLLVKMREVLPCISELLQIRTWPSGGLFLVAREAQNGRV